MLLQRQRIAHIPNRNEDVNRGVTSNVPFLAGIIIKLNAPDKLIVKKMLLTLKCNRGRIYDRISTFIC